MNIAVVTINPGWHTDMIIAEADKRGHHVTPIELGKLGLLLDQSSIELFLKENQLDNIDAAVVRCMKKPPSLRVILDAMSVKGAHIVDRHLIDTYDNNNKLYTYLRLAQHKLLHPKTVYFAEIENYEPSSVLKLLGSTFPVVAKLGGASQGKGVFLLKSEQDYLELIKQLSITMKRQLMFQEYLEHEGDLRILVVGEKVLGGMFRKNADNDFRSNIAIGGEGLKVELDTELERLALAAAKCTGYEIAGVDIMQSNGKNYVIEVNRSPQFKGFVKSTGINVAEEIILYLESLT